jgi:hypothetical protein
MRLGLAAARKPHDYNLNDQLFGWSGAGTALQSHGVDASGRDRACTCGRRWRHARPDILVDRPDGCLSRGMPPDRLPYRDIRSSRSRGRVITKVVVPKLSQTNSTACRAVAAC